jgi:hypothetical protein
MYDEKAYEFINNRAQQINLKVPFESGNQSGIDESQARAVSVFGNRIIFSYFNNLYVYGLRTRTWSVWNSTVRGPIGEIFVAVTDMEYEEAITFSSAIVPFSGSRVANTLHITDLVTTDNEAFVCTVQTKNYNYQASGVYKRLFWWGVDAIFRGQVTAKASPISFSQSITWSVLGAYQWGQISLFAWEQPAAPVIAVETIRATPGNAAIRKFVKMLKSLRFRQINYRLEFETNGDTTTAPVRLFSLTTYVRAHQKVSKTVT